MLAIAYNEQESWGNAVKAAEKAVTFEVEDKSSCYFELGRAYEGMENKEKACELSELFLEIRLF